MGIVKKKFETKNFENDVLRRYIDAPIRSDVKKYSTGYLMTKNTTRGAAAIKHYLRRADETKARLAVRGQRVA